MPDKIWKPLLAFLVALAGGLLFHFLGLPLAWVLGSIAGSATLALCHVDWALPTFVRDLVRPVVGVLSGSAFTATVAVAMLTWWPAILVIIAYSLFSSWLGWLYFRRICRWPPVTAYFSASPGGLSELTLIGASYGGNLRTIATVHSMRIVIVVFTVPFVLQFVIGHPIGSTIGLSKGAVSPSLVSWLVLGACAVFGYAAGRVLKIPGGAMLPALALSALAHVFGLTNATAPWWLVAGVQIIIGSSAGSRFLGVTWRELSTTAVQGVVWALVLVGMTFTAAFATSSLLGIEVPSLALAYAPGGMVEMSLIAFAVGTEVAFVVCCQVSRILFVFLTTPFVFKLAKIGQPPPLPPPPGKT